MLGLRQTLIYRVTNAAGPIFSQSNMLSKSINDSEIRYCSNPWWDPSSAKAPQCWSYYYNPLPCKHPWTETILESNESQEELGLPICVITFNISSVQKALRGFQTAEHVWILVISPVDLHHGVTGLMLWKHKGLVLSLNEPDWSHHNISTASLLRSVKKQRERERERSTLKAWVDYHWFVL